MNSTTPILLVEDDENDVFFMEHALKESGLPNQLMVVRNGRDAIHYLAGEGIYADRERFPRVGLVLLDLSLPFVGGMDVLSWLQQQPFAGELVVVVLTASTNPSDIEKAVALGAAEYQVKPSNGLQLVPLLREVAARWLAGPLVVDPPAARGRRRGS
jgi:CheY-like chemotaxis protein